MGNIGNKVPVHAFAGRRRFRHIVESLSQVANFVIAAHLHPNRKISRAKGMSRRGHFPQRLCQLVGKNPNNTERNHKSRNASQQEHFNRFFPEYCQGAQVRHCKHGANADHFSLVTGHIDRYTHHIALLGIFSLQGAHFVVLPIEHLLDNAGGNRVSAGRISLL